MLESSRRERKRGGDGEAGEDHRSRRGDGGGLRGTYAETLEDLE